MKSIKLSLTWMFLIFVAALHIYTFILMPKFYQRHEVIKGSATPKFDNVKKTFEKNFQSGHERDGASLAVFYDGEAVVNIWAGDADSRVAKKWTKNTRTLLFSLTKPLSSLCVTLLASKGHLNFDDPVAKYWPEYAQNSKENTTIMQILNHEAGLPYIEEAIEISDAEGDGQAVLDKIAAAKPIWQPGSASGYHAVTYGWLIDGIIRGADPKHRSLHVFFDEEIAKPFNLDISIGTPSSEIHRNAHMTLPSIGEYIRDAIIDPRMLFAQFVYSIRHPDSVAQRTIDNPAWLSVESDTFAFNNKKIQQLAIGSVTGVATAHDLAKLFSLLINEKLFRSPLLDELTRPTIESWHWERTVIYPLMKGYGFFYDYHPFETSKYTFGHPGFGCQSIHIDPVHRLVAVYLSNGLKSSCSYLCYPYQRILREVYRSLDSS